MERTDIYKGNTSATRWHRKVLIWIIVKNSTGKVKKYR